mmetsp:Transcript_98843/g.235659  ORF Transcript_98843/g.235659 Transcript_98843/m.235659 type:complete len:249 (+) Transcript_98843:247-993(+)
MRYATPQAKTNQVFLKTYITLRFCSTSFSTASCGCQFCVPVTCAQEPRTKRTTPIISSGLKSKMDKVISTIANDSCLISTAQRPSFSSSSSSSDSLSESSPFCARGRRRLASMLSSSSSELEKSPSPILEDLLLQRRYLPRFKDGSLSSIRKPLGMINKASTVKRKAYMPTTGSTWSSRPYFCCAKSEVKIFTSRMPGPAWKSLNPVCERYSAATEQGTSRHRTQTLGLFLHSTKQLYKVVSNEMIPL